jgi:hypothetical protein
VPVTVRFDEAAGVVEMVYDGATTPTENDDAITRAGTLGAEMLSNRFLVDARMIEAGGTTFDVLALAEFLSSVPPGIIEREAILIPEEAAAADQMEFFETAARNRGLNVRLFDDRDEAIAWLAD